MLLPEWSTRKCPVIGMLHAPALPGAPDYQNDFASVRDRVLRDAETLIAGGIDGLMLENYGDCPFYPGRVPASTVAAMTSLAIDIRNQFDFPLGINVLRNDGQSAMAIAVACGASFIRVNVLCGTRVADQGILQAIAHDLLRDRANLRANHIQIWADFDVKHSTSLAKRDVREEVLDLINRGKADALIVTGSATGQPIDIETLRVVKETASSIPIVIGSGVTADTAGQLAPLANGMIVGSSLKMGGEANNPVELLRVKQIMSGVVR